MELTPKQQVSELIRQAQKILLVTSREPNNDQLAAAIAMQLVLSKLGKEPQVVITDPLPSLASVLKTGAISPNLDGVRDFIVSLDMSHVEVDKLKYNIEGGALDITVTPLHGNFLPEDASFSYGAFQFDLVIAFGVTSLEKIDRMHEANPTMFDGLHLINVDYHRINTNFGSVNLVDQAATSVSEMMISIMESLGQGLMDVDIATALLGGIMSATNNFTSAATTAKALTVAAQMMSAGAKQQEIVKALNTVSRPPQQPQSDSKKKSQVQPMKISNRRPEPLKQMTESDQVLSVGELMGDPANASTSFSVNSPLESASSPQ